MEMSTRPGGLQWKPGHGYSQPVRWDGEAVAKRFREDTGQRLHEEAAVLSRLARVLPVPAVLPSRETLVLRLAYVAGATGLEWVARQDGDFVTRHEAFMRECGKFLRQLHALGSADLEAALPGRGSVMVHGDFARYNTIVDPDSGPSGRYSTGRLRASRRARRGPRLAGDAHVHVVLRAGAGARRPIRRVRRDQKQHTEHRARGRRDDVGRCSAHIAHRSMFT